MTFDSAAVRATKGKVVKPFHEITHYAGFDWARDHHDVVIVERQGQIVTDFRLEHSLAGWQQFRDKTKDYPALGVAIETSQGAAVDQLLQLDCTIYPVNPLSAKSYRERKAQPRSVSNPGKSIRSASATNATRSCAIPCICGANAA